MQTTTTRPDTTRPLSIPLDGFDLPVYRSVIACPGCDGEGEYEGIAAIQSPTATEPRYDVYPCEVCGAHDRPGTGYLRVLRCATCDGVIRQDEIEDVAAADADFEAQLAAIDPEEELLWQRSPDLSRNDLDRVTFCDCGAEDVAPTIDLISRVVSLAVAQAVQKVELAKHGLSVLDGIHGVPAGVALHLGADRVKLWKKVGAPSYAAPHRLSVDLIVTALYERRPTTIGLYARDGIQADHAAWATAAGIAYLGTSNA